MKRITGLRCILNCCDLFSPVGAWGPIWQPDGRWWYWVCFKGPWNKLCILCKLCIYKCIVMINDYIYIYIYITTQICLCHAHVWIVFATIPKQRLMWSRMFIQRHTVHTEGYCSMLWYSRGKFSSNDLRHIMSSHQQCTHTRTMTTSLCFWHWTCEIALWHCYVMFFALFS